MLISHKSRVRLTAEIRGLLLLEIHHHAEHGYVLPQDNITLVERASLEKIEAVLLGGLAV